MAFINEEIENRDRHTIDKERNIILKRAGSSSDGELRYKLLLGGNEIRFAGTSGCSYADKPEPGQVPLYNMNWEIFRLHIPAELKDQKKDILGLIEEALVAHGWNYYTEKASSVKVSFSDQVLSDDMGGWSIV